MAGKEPTYYSDNEEEHGCEGENDRQEGGKIRDLNKKIDLKISRMFIVQSCWLQTNNP